MNLFRSEEHALNWERYDETTASTLRPVSDWADIFANPFFRERLRGDYISWIRTETGMAAFAEVRRRSRS